MDEKQSQRTAAVARAMRRIAAEFPAFQVTDERIAEWILALQHVPEPILERAVGLLIVDPSVEWPRVATLLRYAHELALRADGGWMSEGDAQQAAIAASRAGWVENQERLAASHGPLLLEAFRRSGMRAYGAATSDNARRDLLFGFRAAWRELLAESRADFHREGLLPSGTRADLLLEDRTTEVSR